MYKIVNTDNFGGDYPNESFFVEEPLYRFQAEAICNVMNVSDRQLRHYKIVPLDYILQPGFEP